MNTLAPDRSPEAIVRQAWTEINLDHIRANVRRLLALNGDRAIMAIVKANGYGHGAVRVAAAALEAGATWLGVATPEEGIELRQAGITAPVLVLGAFYPGQEQVFCEYNLTATVATPEAVEALIDLPASARCFSLHLKIDTGMSRLGFLPADAPAFGQRLADAGISISGVYTHLATADAEDTTFALEQLRRFRAVLAELAACGIHPAWRHAGNSAAIMQLPMDDFNLARAGIAMYGLAPSPWLAGRVQLEPAMSVHVRVAAVRRLPAATPVSYGATYVTTEPTTLAVLPIGYADGYTRRLSGKATVLMGGRRFPVVGAICMDQCMVNVGDYPVRVGEEVVLLGRQGDECITAEELAAATGTINYEIVCNIAIRLPRIYHSSGRLEHS